MKWHYAAATAKAAKFLTFDIDVFIFTYLDTVQLCWKLYWKLSKSENKQSLIMRWQPR